MAIINYNFKEVNDVQFWHDGPSNSENAIAPDLDRGVSYRN